MIDCVDEHVKVFDELGIEYVSVKVSVTLVPLGIP